MHQLVPIKPFAFSPWQNGNTHKICISTTIPSPHMTIARTLLISLRLALLSVSHGLLFTELMLNPATAVDLNTQWFEIYNPNDTVVQLKGYRFQHCEASECTTYTLPSSRPIGPNEYIVIGNNGDTATNGGIVLYPLSFTRMSKDAYNMIAIVPPGTDSFEDRFFFSSLDRPFATGVSLHRVSNLGPTISLANWKLSTTSIGCIDGGDKGTPGKQNTYLCPIENRTNAPVKAPTKGPSKTPTIASTMTPTKAPTKNPTKSPTIPTRIPTKSLSRVPTEMRSPTKTPVKGPTYFPAKVDTNSPNKAPASATAPVKLPSRSKRCGLLGFRIVCFNGCGIFGR
jgi:Lamin Tail Domain